MPMLATRGCPYKCSFCSSPQMWTTRYSVREPSDLVDEIEDYVRRYDVKNVDFCDLTAMTTRQWTLDFCDELERRRLGITWQLPVGTRSEGIDEHVLERLAEHPEPPAAGSLRGQPAREAAPISNVVVEPGDSTPDRS